MKKISQKRLGELCKIIDCEHKTAPTQPEGIPLIRTPNIGQGRLILDNVQRISESTFSIWSRRAEPTPGDLIMAREAPVGNVAIILPGQRVCLGQRTVLIRVTSDELDPRFLNYLLNSPTLKGQVILMSIGATVGHLNVTDIRKLDLPPLPSLQVQRKIAAILTAYDDLIETNKRRIDLLEKMAEEIYREWFVRLRFPGYQNTQFIKGIPEGWEIKPISSFCKEIRAGVKKKDLTGNETYIGLEHIPRKSIALKEWGTTESIESNKLRFKERDILFSKIRPYLHKVSLAHFSGVCSSDTIVLRPCAAIYEGFLLFTVFSETFIELATTS
jgi:type I restriction enzyme S subunit